MTMDFRILRKIIYSDEYVGFNLKQHDEIKKVTDELKLPLMSRLAEFYANDVDYGSLELDNLLKEIDKIREKLQDAESIKLLDDLKELIKKAITEKKTIRVLTD